MLAMILTLSILLLNCQQVVSYAEAVKSRKEAKSALKMEQESTISTINDVQANHTLGEEISYIGKSRAITQKPYITRISKSQISMGNYYKATINIYGQAKYGTTVYANIGHQEASQKVGIDQTFGFTLNTISKKITIEFYAIDSSGSKSESVFVTCTPEGDYISNNGTYPTNNKAPVISSNNKVFNLGTNISNEDLLKGVTAYDEEDGDLASKLAIKEHNIKNNEEGTYRVVYKVTDSGGQTTEKENKVEIVNSNIDKELSYTISEGSVRIDKYIGNNTNVVIPEKIKDYPVKNIAYGSFRDNKTIVSVTIQSRITQLNGYMFSGCSNLTTVKLPESLKYIYDNVFEDCTKLKNINIPKNIKIIKNYAFYNCQSLREVDIPEGVNTIEYAAFYGCTNLKKVVVPKSVIYLEQNIFNGCSSELKIYGYKGSYIERYANNYGLNFICIYETDTLPKINAKDVIITVGQSINLMDGVSATDQEEGNITYKIKIVENTVNTEESGIYKVVYEVEDCDVNKVRKEIKVTIKPKVVSNVQAKSNSYSSNKITWSQLLNVDGYEVYRATSKNGTYSLRTTRSSTSYTNTGLTTGKTYYYKVRAYKEVDGEKIYGDFSGAVSSKPMLSSTTAKASSASYRSNKVTWNNVPEASGYEVYRATSETGAYSLRKTVTSKSSLSYTNTGLTTGKTYYYKVKAYRLVDGKKVYSSYSDVVSSKPKLTIPTVTLSSGTKKAYVKWNKISGASGYEVYRATSKSRTYSRVKTVTSGSTTSYTNTSVSSKKGYYYKVRAYRTVDGKKVYSPYSSIKYIKVK